MLKHNKTVLKRSIQPLTPVFMSADGESRRKRKMAEITQALNMTPVDVPALRRMAISEGGLLTDEIRRQVWPRLLNVSVDNIPEQLGKADHLGHLREFTFRKPCRCKSSFHSSETVDRDNNKDFNQVLLDVQRSLRRFPPGELKGPALLLPDLVSVHV